MLLFDVNIDMHVVFGVYSRYVMLIFKTLSEDDTATAHRGERSVKIRLALGVNTALVMVRVETGL